MIDKFDRSERRSLNWPRSRSVIGEPCTLSARTRSYSARLAFRVLSSPLVRDRTPLPSYLPQRANTRSKKTDEPRSRLVFAPTNPPYRLTRGLNSFAVRLATRWIVDAREIKDSCYLSSGRNVSPLENYCVSLRCSPGFLGSPPLFVAH